MKRKIFALIIVALTLIVSILNNFVKNAEGKPHESVKLSAEFDLTENDTESDPFVDTGTEYPATDSDCETTRAIPDTAEYAITKT